MTSPAAGRRVLVVEDELLVSWVAEDLLSDLGCVVIGPATTVEQALGLIASVSLDAAVLDINLNGQTSYPVADALTAAGVPFVFATGYDRTGVAERYRSFPILQKPLTRGPLEAALNNLAGSATSAPGAGRGAAGPVSG